MPEKAILTPEERANRGQREADRWEGLRHRGAELRRAERRVEAEQAREDGIAPPGAVPKEGPGHAS